MSGYNQWSTRLGLAYVPVITWARHPTDAAVRLGAYKGRHVASVTHQPPSNEGGWRWALPGGPSGEADTRAGAMAHCAVAIADIGCDVHMRTIRAADED